METIEKIMSSLGATDVDSRLEEQLIDGILYAFQEQTTEVSVTDQIYFSIFVSSFTVSLINILYYKKIHLNE